ncbi:MAG: ABC transporter ATP-binding protein [Lacipirellulaceae bacterium]
METATTSPADARFVEVFNLVKAYPNPYGEGVRVVDGFNLVMRKGEVVSVIGHSGCGKSTVLTMVAGLHEVSAGSIAVAGREIDGPGPDRAVVFQAPCLLPWLSALENVMLGVNRVYPHATNLERRQIAEYYLASVGLADSFHKRPREMSGGMQQRVGIARAIALKPQMLLLDEPFGRLDSLTRMELQEVILGILDRQRITTMLVTHDVDEAIFMSDRICMMTSGPCARVGQLLDIPFDRPRDRAAVLEHPSYYDLRASMVSFLEGQDHRGAARSTPSTRQDWDDTQPRIEAMSGTQHALPAMQATPIEHSHRGTALLSGESVGV